MYKIFYISIGFEIQIIYKMRLVECFDLEQKALWIIAVLETLELLILSLAYLVTLSFENTKSNSKPQGEIVL